MRNEGVTASWRSTDATACHLSTGGGPLAPNSSSTFPAWSFTPGTISGSMHCTGYGGSSNSRSVTLTILKWTDTDGDGIHDDADTDDDGDGMPDTWENDNNLNPLVDDAEGDPDGDGDDNFAEFTNGTNPQSHEKPQLLEASLSKSRIDSTESVTFTWDSKYATACRAVWLSSVPDASSDNGDLAASGSVTYAAGAFDPGTHTYEFYCIGGGKESDRATVVLTVEADKPPPTVALSVDDATVTAGVDTVELSWSSTGAAFCSYGGNNLDLNGTRTVGPFTAGLHTLTVACVGGTPTETVSDSVIITAVPPPDSDGDGIPDAEDLDDDNDGMTDVCENTYGFDPLNASDGGSTDSDTDGVSNADECAAGTDPRRRELKGFDEYYVAYGKPNSHDIYISRIFDDTVIPGVAGFYLQQSNTSTHFYNIIQQVTDDEARRDGFDLSKQFSLGLSIVDVNKDGVSDLFVDNLENTNLGRWDVLIYGSRTAGGNTLGYVEISNSHVSFFRELAGYLGNSSYFEDTARENNWYKNPSPIDPGTSGGSTTPSYDYSYFNQDAHRLSQQMSTIFQNGISYTSPWRPVLENYFGLVDLFFCSDFVRPIPFPDCIVADDILIILLMDRFFSMYNFLLTIEAISDSLNRTRYMFHYTVRLAADAIKGSRILGIQIGQGFITDRLYYSGRQAKEELAICKPFVDAIVMMTYTGSSPFNKPITGPRTVAELYCPEPLREILPGGGKEWIVETPAVITAEHVVVINLGL